jgi:hypothetical protein
VTANVPKPLSPAAGSSVVGPVTLSWSTPTTSTPIVAYNWQLDLLPNLRVVMLQGSRRGKDGGVSGGIRRSIAYPFRRWVLTPNVHR